MLMGKLILSASALVLIAYGFMSLIAPTLPAGLAGLVISNGDGFAEIGAMYGGLQIGLGLYCLLAVLRPEYYRAGLVLLVTVIGSVALARSLGALITADTLTTYTWGALLYEYTTAIIATVALRKSIR